MTLIGINDLREHTTEVLRRVQEEREEYVITDEGNRQQLERLSNALVVTRPQEILATL